MAYFKYKSKNIYYRSVGKGNPVVFLHGNTGSSKMFEPLLPLYQDCFTIILIDFLGNGQSDRVDAFPVDLWFDEAMQTIALLEHLGYTKTDLIGTSGGAIAAVNAALERPDLVNKVVADSFPGKMLDDNFSQILADDRAYAKSNASQFYQWCQGEDWETVVDKDTEALLSFAKQKRQLFRKPLNGLQTPMLMLGSKEDHLLKNNLLEAYEQIKLEVQWGKIHIFENGVHPAIATNAEEAATIITGFLM